MDNHTLDPNVFAQNRQVHVTSADNIPRQDKWPYLISRWRRVLVRLAHQRSGGGKELYQAVFSLPPSLQKLNSRLFLQPKSVTLGGTSSSLDSERQLVNYYYMVRYLKTRAQTVSCCLLTVLLELLKITVIIYVLLNYKTYVCMFFLSVNDFTKIGEMVIVER